jgi:purine-binding chemotaxis protein CheW
MQLVIFNLGEHYYALRTEDIREIIKNSHATNVPLAPDWVEGLVNLRGDVITLIDLKKLLDLTNEDIVRNIIIVKNKNEYVGLMVNSVKEVLDIDPDIIEVNVSQNDKSYISGIIQLEDKIVNYLDLQKLLNLKK